MAVKKHFKIGQDILHYMVCIYMLLILGILPFYFTDGYGRIGTNKYEFFYNVTTVMGGIFLPVLCICLIFWYWTAWKGARKKLVLSEVLKSAKRDLSVTDLFAAAWGIALGISYLLSDYKEAAFCGDAWKGATGWYMGFVTQICFLGIYFAISRFWRPNKGVLEVGVLASFIVFLLGYCNRFSVYPIEMEYVRKDFLSTIGNMNWYCGYAVTIFFGLLYYWWCGEERRGQERKWVRYFWFLYILTGFGTLLTQGSNSGILTLLVLVPVFYLLSVRSGRQMQRFWQILILLGGAGSVTLLLRYLFPEAFILKDTLTDILTYSVFPVGILVIGVICYKFVESRNKKEQYPEKVFGLLGKIGLVLGAFLAGGLVLAIIWNTLTPGVLGALSENAFFTFNEKWGSLRGATYLAGVQSWLDQDPAGKLFGVGPDCMAMYVHSGANPELLDMIERVFRNNLLTNAHCEWLTILVNEGIFGVFAFGGMMVSAILRYMKAGRTNIFAGACGICLLAYTINNMVSFQQTMATATMFLILGVGEASIRKAKKCKRNEEKK